MDGSSLFRIIFAGSVFLILCDRATGQKASSERISDVVLTASEKSHSYLAGSRKQFVCVAYEGIPQPKIKWYVNHEPVKNAAARQQYGQSSVRATLSVIMYREMDKKSLICEAANNVGEPVRRNITLDVRYQSYVTVQYDQNTKTVICKSYGNPNNFTFGSWHRRVGTEVFQMTNTKQLSSSSWSLQLTEVGYNDIGYYKCEVSNELGAGSQEIFVQPWGAPIFLKPTLNYTTNAESNLTIDFQVYSSPPVVKFGWLRHGLLTEFTDWNDVTGFEDTNVTILVRGHPVELQGQLVTLTLINVTSSLTGNYTLVLTTERGDSSQTQIFVEVLEKVIVTTPAGPIMLEGGVSTGIIILIIVLIVNCTVCLGIIYWRSRRLSQRKAKDKVPGRSRETSKFLPAVSDGVDPPTPPRRTTSVGKVRPKLVDESHYAELDFGQLKNGKKGKSVIRKEPPTEYAWIDFSRSSCSPGAS